MPFIGLDVQPDGEVSICCHSSKSESIGNLREQSCLEIWRSQSLADIRKKFLQGAGAQIPHCSDCVGREALSMTSWRQYYLKEWDERMPAWRAGHATNTPARLGLRFSNRCNFSCRSCRPSASTAWFQDAQFLTPGAPLVALKSTVYPRDMLSEVQKMGAGLQEVYFAGGEPLLDVDHYAVLEFLAQTYPNMSVVYNTNLSTLRLGERDVIPLWRRLSNLSISVSCDGFGPQGEYIRKGMVWPNLVANWARVRAELPHATLSIDCVVSVYNALHLVSFVEELDRSGMLASLDNFNPFPLQEPEWLSLQVLPLEMKEHIVKLYRQSASYSRYTRLRKALDDVMAFMMARDRVELLAHFMRYTKKLDVLRNESFERVFSREAEMLQPWLVGWRSG